MLAQILQNTDIESGGNISKKMNSNLKEESLNEDSKQFLSILKSKMENNQEGNGENNNQAQNGENLQLENMSDAKLSLTLLQDVGNKIKVLEESKLKNEVLALSSKAKMNLKNVLSDISTKKEFDNVKSLEDLVSLAKKYKLNLETLTVEQLSENMLKDTNLEGKTPKNLEQILSNLDKKDNNKSKKDDIKSELSQTKSLTTSDLLNLRKKESSKSATPNAKPIQNDISKLKEELFKEDLTNQKDTKTENSDSKKELNSFLNGIISSAKKDLNKTNSINIQNNLNSKNIENETVVKDLLNKEFQKEQYNLENQTKNSLLNNNTNQTKTITNSQLLNQVSTQVKEQFSLTSILANFDKKDKAVKEIKSSLSLDDPIAALNKEQEKINNMKTSFQSLEETMALRSERNEKNDFIHSKIENAKETLNRLAEDLKEKLKEYKPPIMKMQLQLKPINLGNIDLTVISRGGNLHVQMSATSQVMQMFANNSNDLKDALSNIGFDNVQMNFNSNSDSSGGNSQSQDNQQQSHQETNSIHTYSKVRKSNSVEDSNLVYENNGTQIANNLETISNIELILPKYA
jgi:flagellar hook-length control protein FliK